MKPSFEFARRHVSKVVYALALVGVPVTVIYGTGGHHTIGFWAQAVIWLPISMFALMPFGVFILLGLAPILFIVEKLFPRRLEEFLDKMMMPIWGLFGLVVYVLAADLGHTSDIWLPTPWPNVGALVVMAVASATFAGLIWIGGILEVPNPRPTPGYSGLWSDVAEPAEEFWSPEMVEGWRAWKWENGRLHGVFSAWPSREHTAKCRTCRVVPGWTHVCGIYAVKSPRGVHRFYSKAEVVGRVEMWGNVVEHEHGYRAENARITDLWVASDSLARAIEDRYEVDVHVGSPTAEEVISIWRT